MARRFLLAVLIGAVLTTGAVVCTAAAQPPVPVPPGATRVVSYDRWGGQLAVCAELPDKTAALMQRNGRPLPPTTIFIVEDERVHKVLMSLGGCDPAWSPDGRQLAFTAPDGVWTIAPGSNTGVRLVDTTLSGGAYTVFEKPRWSPDGTRLAFAVVTGAEDGPSSHVQVVRVEDGATVYQSDPRTAHHEWTGPRQLRIGTHAVEIP